MFGSSLAIVADIYWPHAVFWTTSGVNLSLLFASVRHLSPHNSQDCSSRLSEALGNRVYQKHWLKCYACWFGFKFRLFVYKDRVTFWLVMTHLWTQCSLVTDVSPKFNTAGNTDFLFVCIIYKPEDDKYVAIIISKIIIANIYINNIFPKIYMNNLFHKVYIYIWQWSLWISSDFSFHCSGFRVCFGPFWARLPAGVWVWEWRPVWQADWTVCVWTRLDRTALRDR